MQTPRIPLPVSDVVVNVDSREDEAGRVVEVGREVERVGGVVGEVEWVGGQVQAEEGDVAEDAEEEDVVEDAEEVQPINLIGVTNNEINLAVACGKFRDNTAIFWAHKVAEVFIEMEVKGGFMHT